MEQSSRQCCHSYGLLSFRRQLTVSSKICDRPRKPGSRAAGPLIRTSVRLTDEAGNIVHDLKETQRTGLAR